MKKLFLLFVSIIALVSCGNGTGTEDFKEDLIVCFKNSNAMTANLARQLKETNLSDDYDYVDTKLDSIVRTAYKPLVEKYGEEYIVEFLDRNLYESLKDKRPKEEIEKNKLLTIDCFYICVRFDQWWNVFKKIVEGREMAVKDYECETIREMKLTK